MGTPYKMKYTNGKKADPAAAFKFVAETSTQAPVETVKPIPEEVKEVVDKKLEEKVSEVVNQSTSEGLV